MKIFLSFIWFLIYVKILLFWLWLWQLKEYRLDRFFAHFETQAFQKFISSFWRWKYPQFTKKILGIFFTCLIVEILLLISISKLWLAIVITIFLVPLLVLAFQIPTYFWRKDIIKRATLKREQFQDLIVIGITGSYGKTSTKEFLTTILSSKFKVLSTHSHQNTDVSIAQTILHQLTSDIEVFIVEMAGYKRGEIASPCKMVKPKIGILTGINEQHLATFGSLQNTIATKYELIESLPNDGLAIFNGDNDHCYQLYKLTEKEKRIYGFQPMIGNIATDLHVISLAVNRTFLSLKVVDKKGESAVFKANLLGSQNVPNILAAVCCAKELGMPLDKISQQIKKIESWQSGIQLKKGINGLNIIDATYSSNPDGVLSHLDFLTIWPQKKIVIMPCLIELGEASKRIHYQIGQKIGEVCQWAIITTEDRFQEIAKGALDAGMKADHILFIHKENEISEQLKVICQPGDTILLESRVPKELKKYLIITNGQ